ncbi:MAG: rod shape-determining protein [Atribacterota bacterium]|nr:rod shape-determining protein [Atribacterota bacterium]MDD4896802.1 rod shape-determining protein [Atribacterota bacterium]MDD5636636.1 rod shape-determining protein [Atribacterota bacterium]
MFNFSLSLALSRNIGIDLGTSTTLVYVKGKGIILEEPSVVAYQKNSNRVLKVGKEAKSMIGRTPRGIYTIRPLQYGVIANFEVTTEMLRYFIKKIFARYQFIKPSITICVPSGVTEVEKRAVSEVAYECGSRRVFLIEEPIAAAIGAGLPIFEPMGNLIIDMGGGTSEVAVISLGGIVVNEITKVAGDYLNQQIIKYIKDNHGLFIGDLTAEDLKISLSKNNTQKEQDYFEVRGRNRLSGLPIRIRLTKDELKEALYDSVEVIANTVKMALEKTPPELVSDIINKGLVMTGGGALLSDLDKILQAKIKIPVFISKEPLYCVVKGTGEALENFDRYNRILIRTSRSK